MDGRRFCCACGQPLEVIQRKHEDEKVRPTSATKEIFFFYLCIRKTVLLSYVTLSAFGKGSYINLWQHASTKAGDLLCSWRIKAKKQKTNKKTPKPKQQQQQQQNQPNPQNLSQKKKKTPQDHKNDT